MTKKKQMQRFDVTQVATEPGEGSTAVKVFITLSLVEEWLSYNTDNRPPSPRDTHKLARRIVGGRWRGLNGETIVFDELGTLRDGQGRLLAIKAALSGEDCELVGVWSWVVFDVAYGDDLFGTIDQGRPRTFAQILARSGCVNYRLVAGAVSIVYREDSSVPHSPDGFNSDIGMRIYRTRPDIADAVGSINHDVKKVYPVGRAAGLYCVMSRFDVDLANIFWEALASGEFPNKRSPIMALRDALLENKHAMPNVKMTQDWCKELVKKAWCMCRDGKTCAKIKWNPEKEGIIKIR